MELVGEGVVIEVLEEKEGWRRMRRGGNKILWLEQAEGGPIDTS